MDNPVPRPKAAPPEEAMRLPPQRLERVLAFKSWCLDEARFITDTHKIVEGVGLRFNEAGVPLDRMSTAIAVLHAEYAGVGRVWEKGKPPREILFPYPGRNVRGEYYRSPFHVVHQTGEWLRIWVPDTPDDRFTVVPELRAAGVSDYFCVPVILWNGQANGFTFATKSPDGFSDEDVIVLRTMMLELGILMELLALRRIFNEVTSMYVGVEPRQRILSGDVHRGEVLKIRSAIMFADMRDFTTLSMDLSAEETAALLNRYYDCVVPEVESRGGEVLKFIADGILAIFKSGDGADGDAEACARAATAARAALVGVAAANAEPGGLPRFRVGIGLHVGEAAYGNVGSGARLDYTVIGRDVNIASRVAGLCATLGEPLLVSAACAALISAMKPLPAGSHALKGVTGKSEIYILPQ